MRRVCTGRSWPMSNVRPEISPWTISSGWRTRLVLMSTNCSCLENVERSLARLRAIRPPGGPWFGRFSRVTQNFIWLAGSHRCLASSSGDGPCPCRKGVRQVWRAAKRLLCATELRERADETSTGATVIGYVAVNAQQVTSYFFASSKGQQGQWRPRRPGTDRDAQAGSALVGRK